MCILFMAIAHCTSRIVAKITWPSEAKVRYWPHTESAHPCFG